MDHLHGLCKVCINQSNYPTVAQQKNCIRCLENSPDIIINEDGIDIAICAKCYTKEYNSPLKRSQYRNSVNGSFRQSPNYQAISKIESQSKGFFDKQPKMIKKIDSFFAKFKGKNEEMLKEMSKKSLVQLPVPWQKIMNACNKTSYLTFFLISSTQIFGFYHYESIKIGTIVDDLQSGFFLTNRTPIDIQYYRPNIPNIAYNPMSKSILLGKGGDAMQMIFVNNEVKIKCDLIPITTPWIYFFILKL